MPVYQSVCQKCGKIHEYRRKMDERDDTPICCEYRTERRTIAPPMGTVIGPAAG